MNKLLPLICLLPLPLLAQKAPAPRYELRGVVSYFHNSIQGYKPDAGATAYIIKEGVLPPDSLDVGAAEAYRKANVLYSLSSEQKGELLPGEQTPREAYLSAKNRLFALERRLTRRGTTAMADGQGVFSKKMPAGTYWVLVQSAARSTAQMKKVVIKDEGVELAAKFEAD